MKIFDTKNNFRVYRFDYFLGVTIVDEFDRFRHRVRGVGPKVKLAEGSAPNPVPESAKLSFHNVSLLFVNYRVLTIKNHD